MGVGILSAHPHGGGRIFDHRFGGGTGGSTEGCRNDSRGGGLFRDVEYGPPDPPGEGQKRVPWPWLQ